MVLAEEIAFRLILIVGTFLCDTIVDGFSSSSVPLVEKEVFEQIVRTCAIQMEGIDTLENAIVKVAGLEQVNMFLTDI